ncbi:hypothetical protein E1162_18870 [Rhodobacteraceae bacterium RKSG542]|uniref:phage tail tip lysozyme n=1 Tax=Pseudovibrio flavus TaxID=2529854 RepID=UPI0012BCE41C|nr:phage tail tip lysozyme [Pseudovibrio flavus]MTI19310.1 hypothetical protein [Pseudovibrio flavus]
MRAINEIILHCTATVEGQDVSVETIDRWHRERKFSSIGYHFVIGLDGTVHEGRPLERIGAHTKGHNEHSIGIAYVGGLDADRNPKDTRTDAQKTALTKLIQHLDEQYPVKKVSGHNAYSAKACPCFDASIYNSLLKNPSGSSLTIADSTLSRHDEGCTVEAWQKQLRKAGFDLNITGFFDEVTEQATRLFQSQQDIVEDGEVGPQTHAVMEAQLPSHDEAQTFAKDALFVEKAALYLPRLMKDLLIGRDGAAAILGNLGHESAGFRHLQQINGSAYGWAQWDGTRKTNFFKWCDTYSLDKASDEANYGFLLHELRTSEKATLADLAAARGLEAKTIAFEQSYERAGIKHYDSRIRYARLAAQHGVLTLTGEPKSSVRAINTLSQLQFALNFLGANAGPTDNIMGPKTSAAISRFQSHTQLPENGSVSPELVAAVQAVFIAFDGLLQGPHQ